MRLIAIFKPHYGVVRLLRLLSIAGRAAGQGWTPAGMMTNPWYEIAQMACLPARYKRNGDSKKTTERLSCGQLPSNFSKYIYMYPRAGKVIEAAGQLSTKIISERCKFCVPKGYRIHAEEAHEYEHE